ESAALSDLIVLTALVPASALAPGFLPGQAYLQASAIEQATFTAVMINPPATISSVASYAKSYLDTISDCQSHGLLTQVAAHATATLGSGYGAMTRAQLGQGGYSLSLLSTRRRVARASQTGAARGVASAHSEDGTQWFIDKGEGLWNAIKNAASRSADAAER